MKKIFLLAVFWSSLLIESFDSKLFIGECEKIGSVFCEQLCEQKERMFFTCKCKRNFKINGRKCIKVSEDVKFTSSENTGNEDENEDNFSGEYSGDYKVMTTNCDNEDGDCEDVVISESSGSGEEESEIYSPSVSTIHETKTRKSPNMEDKTPNIEIIGTFSTPSVKPSSTLTNNKSAKTSTIATSSVSIETTSEDTKENIRFFNTTVVTFSVTISTKHSTLTSEFKFSSTPTDKITSTQSKELQHVSATLTLQNNTDYVSPVSSPSPNLVSTHSVNLRNKLTLPISSIDLTKSVPPTPYLKTEAVYTTQSVSITRPRDDMKTINSFPTSTKLVSSTTVQSPIQEIQSSKITSSLTPSPSKLYISSSRPLNSLSQHPLSTVASSKNNNITPSPTYRIYTKNQMFTASSPTPSMKTVYDKTSFSRELYSSSPIPSSKTVFETTSPSRELHNSSPISSLNMHLATSSRTTGNKQSESNIFIGISSPTPSLKTIPTQTVHGTMNSYLQSYTKTKAIYYFTPSKSLAGLGTSISNNENFKVSKTANEETLKNLHSKTIATTKTLNYEKTRAISRKSQQQSMTDNIIIAPSQTTTVSKHNIVKVTQNKQFYGDRRLKLNSTSRVINTLTGSDSYTTHIPKKNDMQTISEQSTTQKSMQNFLPTTSVIDITRYSTTVKTDNYIPTENIKLQESRDSSARLYSPLSLTYLLFITFLLLRLH